MKTDPRLSYALCAFGSVVANAEDQISDKDLLVIIEDLNDFTRMEKRKWHREGWSLTHHTWERFERMADRGHLFALHIKHGGQIIRDPDGRLAHILETAQPRQDYSDNIDNSKVLLRCLDRDPVNPWIAHLQCAVAFTFIRQAMISLLANHKMFEFDFQRLVSEIQKCEPAFTDEIIEIIQSLRRYRHGYHERTLDDDNVVATLDDAKAMLTRIFGVGFDNIDAKAPARAFKSPQASIYDIEARILAHHDPVELDKGELLPDIWKLVQHPKALGWGQDGEVFLPHLDAINVAIASVD